MPRTWRLSQPTCSHERRNVHIPWWLGSFIRNNARKSKDCVRSLNVRLVRFTIPIGYTATLVPETWRNAEGWVHGQHEPWGAGPLHSLNGM